MEQAQTLQEIIAGAEETPGRKRMRLRGRRNISAGMKNKWKDPEYKARMIAAMRKKGKTGYMVQVTITKCRYCGSVLKGV